MRAGQDYWIDEWRELTSNEENIIYKVRVNDDCETFSIVEAKSEKLDTEVYLPLSVYTADYSQHYITGIGDNVYSNINNISYLEIDYEDFKSIGNNAFKGCSNLKDVFIYNETPIALGTDAFDGCSNDLVIHVPKESANSYKTNSSWLLYKDRIQPIYTVDDVINTNSNFPRYIDGNFVNLLWGNENGALAYYQDSGDIVFANEEGAYFSNLHNYMIVNNKANGNFEITFTGECGDACFKFVMENGTLEHIVLSDMENLDPNCSALNGTYDQVIRIADILPSDFPLISNSGWVNDKGARAYSDVIIGISRLVLQTDNKFTPSLSSQLAIEGNDYVYDDGMDHLIKFVMDNGSLKEMVVYGDAFNATDYAGTYIPYKYTNPSINIPVGYSQDIEFVTNGKYVNQSTTPVTVSIDGTPLTYGTDYEVTSGSTHVKLKGSYVSTLSGGTHAIKIGMPGYDDIIGEFTIASPSSPKSKKYNAPKTGVE